MHERVRLPGVLRHTGWIVLALAPLYPAGVWLSWYSIRGLDPTVTRPLAPRGGLSFSIGGVLHMGLPGWLGAWATPLGLTWIFFALALWVSHLRRGATLDTASVVELLSVLAAASVPPIASRIFEWVTTVQVSPGF
jgi:hypothetical protein